jgi:uncharacterized protein (DUF433 family)
MTTAQFERTLAQLPTDVKGQMLTQLARDLTNTWPGIERTPGVQGGDACIVRTRIPVWTIETYRRLGWNDSALLANFPALRPADLIYAALYASANRAEIDDAIRAHDAA